MAFRCFAYGSNMLTAKMRRVAPSAKPVGVGHIEGHVLRFNKVSQADGSGKGNIIATGNVDDTVWGVIFEIGDEDRAELDRSEGGYAPTEIRVTTAPERISSLTYVGRPDRINDSLRPYTWYKEFVVNGAREHGLPSDYIAQLAAVEAVADPDLSRDTKERALLPGRSGEWSRKGI
jgi:hypothetical protein